MTREQFIELLVERKRTKEKKTFSGFFQQEKLKLLYEYTSFLPEDASIPERAYVLINNITERPICSECGSQPAKFQSYGYGYCSYKCSVKRSHEINHKPDVRKVAANKARDTRIRNGSYVVSEESKQKMSETARRDDVKESKRKTNLEKYGVENPGVRGAYTSNAARLFIESFIKDQCIDEECCYYHGSVYNDKEFFQMVYDPRLNKKRYFSYDLVVFENKQAAENKDLSKINLVLEYNGPWHYTETDVMYMGDMPAVPYKSQPRYENSIRESYRSDRLKLDHIRRYTNNIIIYWEGYRCFDDKL